MEVHGAFHHLGRRRRGVCVYSSRKRRAGDELGFGPGGSPQNAVSLGNNKWHYIYDEFMDPTLRTSLRWARDNVYDPTDLVALTGTWQVHDVFATSADYGNNGLYGWVDCPASATTTGSNPNRTCYGQTLYLNQYSGYAFAFDTENERRFQACHELGHTVGLRHPTSSYTTCMNTGALSTTSLHSHDINHINSHYD